MGLNMVDLSILKEQMQAAKERAKIIEAEIENKMKVLPGKDTNYFQNKIKKPDQEVSVQLRHSK